MDLRSDGEQVGDLVLTSGVRSKAYPDGTGSAGRTWTGSQTRSARKHTADATHFVEAAAQCAFDTQHPIAELILQAGVKAEDAVVVVGRKRLTAALATDEPGPSVRKGAFDRVPLPADIEADVVTAPVVIRSGRRSLIGRGRIVGGHSRAPDAQREECNTSQ